MTIRPALDAALKTALTVASVTGAGLATGGVWNGQADQGVLPPYVIFNQQSEFIAQTFDKRLYREVYLVKAVVKGWPALASAIDAACDAILNNKPLTITGVTHIKTLREGAVNYSEDVAGVRYWHVGGLYGIEADQAG